MTAPDPRLRAAPTLRADDWRHARWCSHEGDYGPCDCGLFDFQQMRLHPAPVAAGGGIAGLGFTIEPSVEHPALRALFSDYLAAAALRPERECLICGATSESEHKPYCYDYPVSAEQMAEYVAARAERAPAWPSAEDEAAVEALALAMQRAGALWLAGEPTTKEVARAILVALAEQKP